MTNDSTIDFTSPLRVGIHYLHEGLPVISPEGDIDIATTPMLEAALNAMLDEKCPHVMLDLSSVRYLDSTGLGIILKCHRQLRAQNSVLSVVSAPPIIQRLLEITRLHRVLNIYADTQQAIAASQAI